MRYAMRIEDSNRGEEGKKGFFATHKTRPSEDMLRQKENESIFIIREAVACYTHPALLWSVGKDSTAMLHIVRKAFFGIMPMPVIHIDTGSKFPEMYEYRDRWAKEWKLNLVMVQNRKALQNGIHCCMDDKMTCCQHLKTEALRQAIRQHGFDALFVGIRRDEHGVRAKERYFSPRRADSTWDYKHQPLEIVGTTTYAMNSQEHMRVHPLLHWTELDVWCYTQLEGIPVNDLYFSRDGWRYRSLGCQPATKPVRSDASDVESIVEELLSTQSAERAGRIQDKESAERMQRLRSLGYM